MRHKGFLRKLESFVIDDFGGVEDVFLTLLAATETDVAYQKFVLLRRLPAAYDDTQKAILVIAAANRRPVYLPIEDSYTRFRLSFSYQEPVVFDLDAALNSEAVQTKASQILENIKHWKTVHKSSPLYQEEAKAEVVTSPTFCPAGYYCEYADLTQDLDFEDSD